jgi:hypothetical protein
MLSHCFCSILLGKMAGGCGLVLGGIAQGLCEMAKSGLKEKKKWG